MGLSFFFLSKENYMKKIYYISLYTHIEKRKKVCCRDRRKKTEKLSYDAISVHNEYEEVRINRSEFNSILRETKYANNDTLYAGLKCEFTWFSISKLFFWKQLRLWQNYVHVANISRGREHIKCYLRQFVNMRLKQFRSRFSLKATMFTTWLHLCALTWIYNIGTENERDWCSGNDWMECIFMCSCSLLLSFNWCYCSFLVDCNRRYRLMQSSIIHKTVYMCVMNFKVSDWAWKRQWDREIHIHMTFSISMAEICSASLFIEEKVLSIFDMNYIYCECNACQITEATETILIQTPYPYSNMKICFLIQWWSFHLKLTITCCVNVSNEMIEGMNRFSLSHEFTHQKNKSIFNDDSNFIF